MADGKITHDVVVFLTGAVASGVLVLIILVIRDALRPINPYQGAPTPNSAEPPHRVSLEAELREAQRELETMRQYTAPVRKAARAFIVAIPLDAAREHAVILKAAHDLSYYAGRMAGVPFEAGPDAKPDSPFLRFATAGDSLVATVRKDPAITPAMKTALEAYDAATDLAFQEMETRRRKYLPCSPA